MLTWKLKTRAVNSPSLFNEIREFVDEGMEHSGVSWDSESHRESFVEVVDEWLTEKFEEGKIVQWNVLCDNRNNTIDEMDKGNYIFDVYFKQTNCLNTTHLQYLITNEDLSIDFLLE